MEEMFREAIYKALSEGKSNFVIFPFGEQGKLFKRLLNHEFGIEEILIIDNGNHQQDDHIKTLHTANPLFLKNSTIFLVSDNFKIYLELRKQILQYVPKDNIVDAFEGDRKTLDMISGCLGGNTIKVLFNPILNLRKERSVKALGNNTGNLVFVEAVKEQVKYDYEDRLTREWTREMLGKKNVVSIMPASNFLQKDTRWCEDYIPILQDTDIRLTFVGLGAQANFDETPKDVVSKLTENQKSYFRLVSEHAVEIGVRGEFTAECLKEIGITNVEVIGCPSFYQYRGGYSKLAKASVDKILYTDYRSKRSIYVLENM